MATEVAIRTAFDEVLTIAQVAKKMQRTPDCIKKWNTQGRRNRFTHEIVYCQLTSLPSGGWGISESQYRDFLAKLNEKP